MLVLGFVLFLGQPSALPRGVRIVPGDPADMAGGWEGPRSRITAGGQAFRMNPDGLGYREFVYVEFLENGATDALSEREYLQPDAPAAPHACAVYLSVAQSAGTESPALRYPNPELALGISVNPQGRIRALRG